MKKTGYSKRYQDQKCYHNKQKPKQEWPTSGFINNSVIEKYSTETKYNKPKINIQQSVSSRNEFQLIYNFLTSGNEAGNDNCLISDLKQLDAFGKLRQKLRTLDLAQKLFAGEAICLDISKDGKIIQFANTFNLIKIILAKKKPLNSKEYKQFLSSQNSKLIQQLEFLLLNSQAEYFPSITEQFIIILEKIKKGQNPIVKRKNPLLNNSRIITLLEEIYQNFNKKQQNDHKNRFNSSKVYDFVKSNQHEKIFKSYEQEIFTLKAKIKNLNSELTETRETLEQSNLKDRNKQEKLEKERRKGFSIQENEQTNRETFQIKAKMLKLFEQIISITHQNQNLKKISQLMKQAIFAGQEQRGNHKIQYIRIKQKLADRNHKLCQLQAQYKEIDKKNYQLIQQIVQLQQQNKLKDEQIQILKSKSYGKSRQKQQNDQTYRNESYTNLDLLNANLPSPLMMEVIEQQESNNQLNKYKKSQDIEVTEEITKYNMIQKQIDHIKQIKSQIEDHLDAAHRRITLQDFNIDNITKKNQFLQAEIEQKKLYISNLNAQLQSLKQSLYQQKQYNSHALNISQMHEKEISAKSSIIDSMQNKLEQSKKQQQEKCTKLAQIQNKLALASIANQQNIIEIQKLVEDRKSFETKLKEHQYLMKQNQNLLSYKDNKIVTLQRQIDLLVFKNSELQKDKNYTTKQMNQKVRQINQIHSALKQKMEKQIQQNKTIIEEMIKSSSTNINAQKIIQIKQEQIKNINSQLAKQRQTKLILSRQSNDKTKDIQILQQKLCRIPILQQQLLLRNNEKNSSKKLLEWKQNKIAYAYEKLKSIKQMKREFDIMKKSIQQEIKMRLNELIKIHKLIELRYNEERQKSSQSQLKLIKQLDEKIKEKERINLQLQDYKKQLKDTSETISQLARDINQEKENNKITLMAHTSIIEDQRKTHKQVKDQLEQKIKNLCQEISQRNEKDSQRVQQSQIIAKLEKDNWQLRQECKSIKLKVINLQQERQSNEQEIQKLKQQINHQSLQIKDIESNLLQQFNNLHLAQINISEQKNIIEQNNKLIQKLYQQKQEFKNSLKTSSDLQEEVKIKQKKIQQLQQKLILITKQLSKRSNSNDLQVDLLFQNNIFDDMIDYKGFLKQSIQKHTKRLILSTKLIFTFDPLNKVNFHEYLKNKANILLIVKMMNGYYFACYSEGAIQPNSKENKDGLIISITNRDVFQLVNRQKRPVTYDEYYLIFGNSEVRIKSQENKVFSNFGISNQFYCSRGKKVNWLIGGDKNEREQDLQYYQIYQIAMSDF